MKRITGTIAEDLPHPFTGCSCGQDGGETCGLCTICRRSAADDRHVSVRELAEDEATLPREKAAMDG